jgi:hypothetical protein
MAIMNPFQRERDDLRERIHRARSSDEARYYEEKLWRLEREMLMQDAQYFASAPMLPVPMPTSLGVDLAASETKTPLSFLKNADKKLLLIGEMA